LVLLPATLAVPRFVVTSGPLLVKTPLLGPVPMVLEAGGLTPSLITAR
jgi:hypothetical protein